MSPWMWANIWVCVLSSAGPGALKGVAVQSKWMGALCKCLQYNTEKLCKWSVATQQCSSCQNINNTVYMAKCSQCWIEIGSRMVYIIILYNTNRKIVWVQKKSLLCGNVWITARFHEPQWNVLFGRHPQTSMEHVKGFRVLKTINYSCSSWVCLKGLDIGLFIAVVLNSSLMLNVTWGDSCETSLDTVLSHLVHPLCVTHCLNLPGFFIWLCI